jgi:fibronectin type 3 domain-containing protein
MKMFTKTHVAGVLLLTGTLFLAGGCGYKTEPIPPDAIVPKAIEDLRHSVSEKGVTLTWTFPKKTIKGTALTDISTFDVYRAVVPMNDYCPTCPIPFREAIQVPGGVVDPEGKRQGTYETALLRSGHKYFFKVNVRTSWWAASADSNVVSFIWHIPAKAPESVKVEATDSTAIVTWQAVTGLMDGEDISYPLLYQVQRSKDNTVYSNIGEMVSGTRFVDTGLQNGATYYYRVQSVLMVENNSVSGGLSNAVSVVPLDRTPPAAPTGVTVVQTAGGIKVFWDKSQEADVNGYRVYRRSADEKQARFVGDVSAVYTIFEDSDVPAGTSVYYSITAYDKMESPNESAKSREAGVRH